MKAYNPGIIWSLMWHFMMIIISPQSPHLHIFEVVLPQEVKMDRRVRGKRNGSDRPVAPGLERRTDCREMPGSFSYKVSTFRIRRKLSTNFKKMRLVRPHPTRRIGFSHRIKLPNRIFIHLHSILCPYHYISLSAQQQHNKRTKQKTTTSTCM